MMMLSTLALTFLEYIDKQFPSHDDVRDRFGEQCEALYDETRPIVEAREDVVGWTTGRYGPVRFFTFDNWRNRLYTERWE